MELQSQQFSNNQFIPKRYTGEGENVSPPLSWKDVPKDTKELVLICDDPDAPKEIPFVHWVAYNISPETNELPENFSEKDIIFGRNSFGEIKYGGPMPPKGHGSHHYHFKLYALKEKTSLEAGASKEQLLEHIKDKIIDKTELVGIYERH